MNHLTIPTPRSRTTLGPATLLVALLAALLPLGPAVAAPKVGAPAPAFSGTDTSGKAWQLADLKGTPVILEWTNHDCPFVVKHYGAGNMQALQREATAAGYTWLTVISSAPGKQGHVTPSEADRLTASRDAAPSAVLLDPEGTIGQAYGARTTPHMFIIDAAGTLVYMGGIDDRPTADPADIAGATNYVRQAIADLAAGEPVRAATTKPYGCSIKY